MAPGGVGMYKALLAALFIALLTVGALLGKVACNKFELEDANAALNQQLMQANLELGRAHTEFGDANDYIDELEQGIQDEIAEREAIATRYGELEAKLSASGSSKSESIIKYLPGEPIFVPAHLGLEPGSMYLAESESELSRLAWIKGKHDDFRIHIDCMALGVMVEGIIPMKIDYTFDLRIKGVFAETLTPSGAVNHYLTLTELDDEGNEVGKLKLEKFDMIVNDQREAQWYWWAPHVDIGAFGGYHTMMKPGFGGSLGFSVMGYGLTENDLSWRVLRVSADVSDTFGFGLTPGMYNLGELIPLVSNIWIGPHVIFNVDGTQIVGIWIGAVL
jgi:hypothetical protein